MIIMSRSTLTVYLLLRMRTDLFLAKVRFTVVCIPDTQKELGSSDQPNYIFIGIQPYNLLLQQEKMG